MAKATTRSTRLTLDLCGVAAVILGFAIAIGVWLDRHYPVVGCRCRIPAGTLGRKHRRARPCLGSKRRMTPPPAVKAKGRGEVVYQMVGWAL